MDIGVGMLPRWFQKQFNQDILNKPLNTQKTWLINIRKGRIRYDSNNLYYDEFTNPGAFRNWLGF